MHPPGESSEIDPEREGADVHAGGHGTGGERPGGRAEILVSVEGGHLERLAAVAEELRSAGMEVGAVMDDLGVVSGSVEPEKMARLAAVTGVASVEATREVRIPPPDSPVQ